MINWSRKERAVGKSSPDYDITINYSKRLSDRAKNGQSYYSIALRNGAAAKISSSGYMVLGADVDAGRVYFREAAMRDGFKASVSNNNPQSAYFHVPADLHDFVGDYDLKYDAKMGMCYVQKNVESIPFVTKGRR